MAEGVWMVQVRVIRRAGSVSVGNGLRVAGVVAFLLLRSVVPAAGAVAENKEQWSDSLQRLSELEAVDSPDAGRPAAIRNAYSGVILQGALLGETTAVWELLGRRADFDRQHGASVVESELSQAVMVLHRELMQQSADERFELLRRWTFSPPSKDSVRSLFVLTSAVAPPPEFARALGKRPSRNTFPVPTVGPADGVFSTLWLLIEAADDAGYVRSLRNDFQVAVDAGDTTAAFGLMLIDLHTGSRDDRAVQNIRSRLRFIAETTDIRPAADSAANSVPIATAPKLPRVSDDYLIAAAALLRHDLRRDAMDAIKRLEALRSPDVPRVMRSRFQQLLLSGVSLAAGAAGEDVSAERARDLCGLLQKSSAPRFWIPGTVDDSTRQSPERFVGGRESVWLSHEGHVQHITGRDIDFLFFRYPLTGDFEFSVEGQEGGPAGLAGGITWNALAARPYAGGSGGFCTITTPDKKFETELTCPFIVQESAVQFHRMSVAFSGQTASLLINGQTMWHESHRHQRSGTDELATGSVPDAAAGDPSVSGDPWIGLRSSCEFRPLFRNLKIEGRPVIPRSVRLSAGSLNGWIPAAAAESRSSDLQTPPSGLLNFLMTPVPDWKSSGGMITRRPVSDPLSPSTGSRLTYFRPLQTDERIRYEFFCEDVPGVFPTVGSLAFVLSEDSVRLRWLVDSDGHWTGLPRDNVITDPLSQRHRGPLPIRPHDWNTVEVSVHDRSLRIHLNDALVLEKSRSGHGLETGSDLQ
ncbi:MAG: DUF1583 domain-containing protein, partial [Planctomycetaceae bacterium]|nr:DUF1583 domain-containing protein [Planctomycetaceae bacterium]